MICIFIPGLLLHGVLREDGGRRGRAGRGHVHQVCREGGGRRRGGRGGGGRAQGRGGGGLSHVQEEEEVSPQERGKVLEKRSSGLN